MFISLNTKSAHPRRSEHKKLCTGNAQRVTVAHTVYVVDEITHQKASYLPINYSYYKGQCAKSKFIFQKVYTEISHELPNLALKHL